MQLINRKDFKNHAFLTYNILLPADTATRRLQGIYVHFKKYFLFVVRLIFTQHFRNNFNNYASVAVDFYKFDMPALVHRGENALRKNNFKTENLDNPT